MLGTQWRHNVVYHQINTYSYNPYKDYYYSKLLYCATKYEATKFYSNKKLNKNKENTTFHSCSWFQGHNFLTDIDQLLNGPIIMLLFLFFSLTKKILPLEFLFLVQLFPLVYPHLPFFFHHSPLLHLLPA